MGFHVLDPCIFRIVLFLLCVSKQHVETREVLVIVDHRPRLLSVEDGQLVDSLQEHICEFLFFFTKPNFRYVDPRTPVLPGAIHL